MKVVLLHSALGDSRLWKRQVAALSPEHEVVTPDLPGWGETPLPTEPFSFVDAVAEHLPAALVGNSFGGGGRAAHRAREAGARLAARRHRARACRRGTGRRRCATTGRTRRLHGKRATTTWRRRSTSTSGSCRSTTTRCGRSSDARSSCSRRTRSRRSLWPEMAPLESLAIPTLVVVGENDKADFRAIAQHLAEHIPGRRARGRPRRRPSRRRRPAGRAERLLLEFLSG